jgi:hypothetical protein
MESPMTHLMRSHRAKSSPPSDVCLLLRAHAEQQWLSKEVVPVIRELERPSTVPEEQLGAAMAYLEVIWQEARLRARETEAVFDELARDLGGDALTDKAYRYHTAVANLREVAGKRVDRLLRGADTTSSHCVDPQTL